MTASIHAQVEILREALAQKFAAQQIILFGSQANGLAFSDSDIDLCVITSLRNRRKIDLLREIRRELGDRITLPLDILIYHEEEFFERAQLANTLEYKIRNDGVKVYER